MKKVLIILIVFIIFPLLFAGWPIYQGLAYRGKVPMFGFDYVNWPSEQPFASEVLDTRFESLDNDAQQLLLTQQKKVAAPGYTAAVAIGGKTVWAGSVGWADISEKVAMTTNTQLRIGSTSKALTSTALARLVASKKMDLDEPLKHAFSPLPNKSWGDMTARQLSSHMAGVPHYGENTETIGKLETLGAQTHYGDVMESLTLFDESDLRFKPGEAFSYSSFGTVLLSAWMQVKANKPYQEVMQDTVFKPLNMEHSGTEIEASSHLASFYWQNESNITELKPWYDLDLSHRLAGGGWVSTSKDLVTLGQGFMDTKFIPAEVRDEFWTPQRLNSGEVNEQKYGIGWRVHDLNLGEGFKPLIYMHHGGVSAGAQSFLMVIPEYKMSIAVNANVRTQVFWDFGSVSYDLARLFIRELEAPSLVSTH